jgi:hypothetical protein
MSIRSDVAGAAAGWRDDPARTWARLAVSFILGQGIFWRWGYDQVSIGRARAFEVGPGEDVAEWLWERMPHTVRALFVTKVVEIMADLGKCWTEGATYHRLGITPDVVACTVTQPLWSTIEAIEKAGSMTYRLSDYRRYDEEEHKVALACIYGSCFRYVHAAAMLLAGPLITRYGTEPLTRLTRRTGALVPAGLAVAIGVRAIHLRRAYRARTALSPG